MVTKQQIANKVPVELLNESYRVDIVVSSKSAKRNVATDFFKKFFVHSALERRTDKL